MNYRCLLVAGLLLACNNQMPPLGDDAGHVMQTGPDATVMTVRKELTSGSRLKAQYINGEDGSQVAVGLFDTKLGVPCVFDTTEDGKTRCLPKDVADIHAINLGASYPQTVYLDSDCKQRAAVSSMCQPPVRYVKYSQLCGEGARVAPVSEVHPPPPYLYFQQTANGTGCGLNPIDLYQLRVYAVGKDMDPSEFEAGTTVLQ